MGKALSSQPLRKQDMRLSISAPVKNHSGAEIFFSFD